MIICSCNVITDHHVRACLSGGGDDCPRTPADVYRALGHRPACGRCAITIRELVISMGPATASPCGHCAVAELCEPSLSHEDFTRQVMSEFAVAAE
ncbi:MAG: (2Fe-2S)-binding protein [Hyphomicrobiaceae bacterium]|nr:(2Fe-2S)-binding protein [Hyphomicrobiaceae bacterium]